MRVWPGELLLHAVAGRSFHLAFPGFRLALPLPGSEAFAVSSGVAFVGKEAVAFWRVPVRATALFPAECAEEPLDGSEPFWSDDREILRGRRRLAAAGSAEAARMLAKRLEMLRTAPRAERPELRARMLDEAFDLASARESARRYRESTASARAGGWAIAALLFGALPLSLYTPAGRFLTPGLCLLLAAGAWYWSMRPVLRLLRESGLDRPSRVLAYLHFVLLPVSASRAPAVAARHLFERYDFLTLAAALLPPGAFAACARRERERLEHLPADAPFSLRGAAEERAARLRRLVLEALGRSDVPEPERRESTSVTYCPMCETELLATAGECADCGVALVAYRAAEGPPGGTMSG